MNKNFNKDQGKDKRSADEQKDRAGDLPGYPHYPSNEDILNPDNGLRKTSGDVEDLANSRSISGRAAGNGERLDINEGRADNDDDIKIVPGTEADVTRDDLVSLGDKDADQDMGDDELVGNARVDKRDIQGDELEEDELDIPGTEDDDADESLGEEDEENNYYSLGGDNHDNLEEDQA